MPLYHCQLGFPARFQAPVGDFRLKYSWHARRAARNDRYGNLTRLLPATLNTEEATLIEVEQDEQGRTVKLLYRVRTRTHLDIVLAISPGKSPWSVKTCWANEREDDHKTLNHSRYALAC